MEPSYRTDARVSGGRGASLIIDVGFGRSGHVKFPALAGAYETSNIYIDGYSSYAYIHIYIYIYIYVSGI